MQTNSNNSSLFSDILAIRPTPAGNMRPTLVDACPPHPAVESSAADPLAPDYHFPFFSPDPVAWPLSPPGRMLVHVGSRKARKVAFDAKFVDAHAIQLHAESLASQLGYNPYTATDHNCAWYQNQMAEGATVDDAAELRLLTMIVCREHRSLVTEKAELVGRSPVLDELRREERRREMGMVVFAVAALLTALALGWCARKQQQQMPDAGIAGQVQRVQL